MDILQAEYIAEIRLRNLNREYLLKRTKEIEALEKDIDTISEQLENPKKIQNIIAAELRDVIKKYGVERKTEIIYEEQKAIATEPVIEDYPINLLLTKDNYFKKIAISSVRPGTEQLFKEGDIAVQEITASNTHDILFFSDRHNVYKLRAHEIADLRMNQMGIFLNNLLSCPEGERIIFIAATNDYSGHLLFAFENAKFAKITMESYATKTYRRKQLNAYSDKSPLIYAAFLGEDEDILAIRETAQGADRAAIFNTSVLPIYQTKNAAGIIVMRLKQNSFLGKVFKAADFDTANLQHLCIETLPSGGGSFNAFDFENLRRKQPETLQDENQE